MKILIHVWPWSQFHHLKAEAHRQAEEAQKRLIGALRDEQAKLRATENAHLSYYNLVRDFQVTCMDELPPDIWQALVYAHVRRRFPVGRITPAIRRQFVSAGFVSPSDEDGNMEPKPSLRNSDAEMLDAWNKLRTKWRKKGLPI